TTQFTVAGSAGSAQPDCLPCSRMIEFHCWRFEALIGLPSSSMRDPLTWSMPLARVFGITVRVHVLFPFVALGIILRVAFMKDAPSNLWVEAAIVMGLLFVAVLQHEFGHCFGARFVDGDAHEILLWPLGGLAAVDVPHTPRANFLTAAAGPLVNILLCLAVGAALTMVGIRPPFSPWWVPITYSQDGLVNPELYGWDGALLSDTITRPWGHVLLARFFWVNWILFLLNAVLIGFPMDAGRMFQCILWPRLGFRQATYWAVMAGFVTMLVLGIYAIAME